MVICWAWGCTAKPPSGTSKRKRWRPTCHRGPDDRSPLEHVGLERPTVVAGVAGAVWAARRRRRTLDARGFRGWKDAGHGQHGPFNSSMGFRHPPARGHIPGAPERSVGRGILARRQNPCKRGQGRRGETVALETSEEGGGASRHRATPGGAHFDAFTPDVPDDRVLADGERDVVVRRISSRPGSPPPMAAARRPKRNVRARDPLSSSTPVPTRSFARCTWPCGPGSPAACSWSCIRRC